MKKKFRNVVIIFLLKFERYRQILNIKPKIMEIAVLNIAWKKVNFMDCFKKLSKTKE
jgi:hypothetical protein